MIWYFKGVPIQLPFKVESNTPVFAADSVSLRAQRAGQDAQRWELSFNCLAYLGAPTLLLDRINGTIDPQSMTMPQFPGIHEATTTTSATASAASAGASSVTLATNNGLIPFGAFIKFGNHSKVYLVRADRSGTGALSIYPKLRFSLPAGTSVQTSMSSSPTTFSYLYKDSSIQGVTVVDGNVTDPGTIELVEAF